MNNDLKEQTILSEVILQATRRQQEMLMPPGLREDVHRGWAFHVRNMIEPLTSPGAYATHTETPTKIEATEAFKKDWESNASAAKRPPKKAKK